MNVGVSVPDDTPVDGEIGQMLIPGGAWVAGFEPAEDEYPKAWHGVCYEQYLNDPEQHPEHTCVVSSCVPVKPLQSPAARGPRDP